MAALAIAAEPAAEAPEAPPPCCPICGSEKLKERREYEESAGYEDVWLECERGHCFSPEDAGPSELDLLVREDRDAAWASMNRWADDSFEDGISDQEDVGF